MKKNQNQKGFGLIEGLLLIIAVALVVFVGYYVWHTQKQTDKTLNQASSTSQSTAKAPVENLVPLKMSFDGGRSLSFEAPKGWSQTPGFENKIQRTIGGHLYVVAGQLNDQDFLKLDSYQSNFNGIVGSAKSSKGHEISIIKLDPDNTAKEGNLALSSCQPDQSGFGCSLDLDGSSLLILVSGSVGGQSPMPISFSGSSYDEFINELQRIIRTMPV